MVGRRALFLPLFVLAPANFIAACEDGKPSTAPVSAPTVVGVAPVESASSGPDASATETKSAERESASDGGSGEDNAAMGHTGILRRFSGKSPTVRQGATSVNGPLPPEIIQRIVRQNLGRFRLCYENGLKKNPKLGGTVKVRFVINRSGDVENPADDGSSLPDQAVISCVVHAFGTLSYPKPEGGIVTVSDPIIFAPLELDPPKPAPRK